ncbi:MAG: PH domain-containing protein [Oscillospiraceae bacterium]|nr:PH domain-containing protein [Oscillospiraceae bacterium]
MPTVSSGILSESNFLNLKGIPPEEVRPEVFDLLVDGEQPVAAFKTVRDQVIFTTKRIFVVNVQGLSGKKVSYFSYPYSKVQYFGVETAGLLDIDSELILAFSNGSKLTFDFKTSVDIRKLNTLISNYVL